jgi:hypothetical protein
LTSLSCTIWKLTSGLPNCSRCRQYATAASYAAVAWPSAPHATALRVPASTRPASLKLFGPGSRFSSGTRTPDRVISACQTARSDPLPSIRRAS